MKTERIVELIDLQKSVTNEINRALVGTEQEVLAEEYAAEDRTRLIGRTDNFKTTIVPASMCEPGDLVGVDIVDARGATLYGAPIRNTACAT